MPGATVMGTLFPILLSLRLLTFSCIFVVPSRSLILPSLRIVLCSVVSFRFLLPELSSHFVLHYLLCSFPSGTPSPFSRSSLGPSVGSQLFVWSSL